MSLVNPDDMRLVLEGMIKNGYFKTPKPVADVIKHLYIEREDKAKERAVLEGVLGQLVNNSKLKIEGGTCFLE